MAVSLRWVFEDELLLVKYTGTYTLADAEAVLESFRSDCLLRKAKKLLVDIRELDALDSHSKEREDLRPQFIEVLEAEFVLLAIFYGAKGAGKYLASSIRGAFDHSLSVVAMSTDQLADLEIFLGTTSSKIEEAICGDI